jgi:hypothetical protein
MASKELPKKVGKVLLFIILNLFFTSLIIWVAYTNRTQIKKWMDHDTPFSKEDKVILYDIFSSPLIDEEADLVNPPVKNSDDLVNYIYKSTLPDTMDLVRMFDSCRVVSAEKFRSRILKIRFILYKDTLDCYAHFSKISPSGKESHTAVLHMSGSGDNRSIKVANRLMDKEDPTEQAEQIQADIYFPVYPAGGVRAIHDGVKMLDIKKISSYTVSIGRSFALRYFADVFAIEKYLRNRYRSLHAWGHSRGGSVAAIAGSIFLPDTMIISSGYSVASNKFFRLGADQAWWPHSSVYWDKDAMKARLKNRKTICYFLFGKQEVDDMYGLESKYLYTENFFKDCPNVKVMYADSKHIWFRNEITEILKRK